jgi:hypothetical protein
MNAAVLEEVRRLSKLEKLELAMYLIGEVSKAELEIVPNAASIRETDPILGYDVAGNPLFASVAKKQFGMEIERVRQGDYMTIEDLEKEMETW